MVAEHLGQVKVEKAAFRETWNKLSPTEKKCCALAMLAIEEAVPILIEEGGIEGLIKGLAVFMHGEALPAPVMMHLEEQVAKLKAKAG